MSKKRVDQVGKFTHTVQYEVPEISRITETEEGRGYKDISALYITIREGRHVTTEVHVGLENEEVTKLVADYAEGDSDIVYDLSMYSIAVIESEEEDKTITFSLVSL